MTSTSSRDPNWAARSFVCGYFASTAMLMVLMAAYGLTLLVAATNPGWTTQLTDNLLTSAVSSSPYLAVALHFLAGTCFAMGFGYFVYPSWQGPSWQRGVVYSFALYLFSLVIFFPLVGAGAMGFGLGAGPLPMVGNLVLHVVYGLTLGGLYGYLSRVQPGEHIHGKVVTASTRNAALGLTFGALIGLTVGAGLLWALSASGPSHLHMPEAWVRMTAGMVGSALGCLIGLVSGQSTLETRSQVLPAN